MDLQRPTVYSHYAQSTSVEKNTSLPSAFMTSSKFSLEASLYFLLSTSVIFSAMPVRFHSQIQPASFADLVLPTEAVRALSVDDIGYGVVG